MISRRAPRRGNIVVAVAAGAMLFVGLLALVIDVGTWYIARARARVVVDLAAELALRRPASDPGEVARELAARNGFAEAQVTATRTRVGARDRLEVRLQARLSRYFSQGSQGPSLIVRGVAERDEAGRVFLRP